MMEELSKEKELVGIYISGHPLDDFKTEIEYFCNSPLSILQNLDNLLNREAAFGGIISNVEHKLAKNGKGWASFSFEDYTNSYEFRIFGEEYLKFKHFLVPNSFLYIKIIGRKGWTNDVRVSFINIQLLQDVLDEFSKKITLNLAIEDVNESKINKLNVILNNYKGVKKLNFVVFDTEEKLKLTLPSRSCKVTISNELLTELKKEQVKFKLN